MVRSPHLPRIAAVGGAVIGGNRRLILAVGALVLITGLNLFDLYVNSLGHGLRFVDANWEFSWSHDLDTAILGAGVVAAIVGSRRASAKRRFWRSTAAILGLFFLDEATPAHSAVDQLQFGKLLYVPILLGLALSVWVLAANSNQRTIVIVGVTTLFLSFGMHVGGVPALRRLGYYNGIYQAAVGVKQGLESAGLILLMPSLWRLASARQLRGPAVVLG